MADDNDLDMDLDEQPKRSPLVMILVIVNVVVIGGAAAAFLLFGGGGEDEEDDGEGGTSSGDSTESQGSEASSEEPGPIVAMPPFVVNLSDEERAHYLKVAVSIELRDERAKLRYEPRKTHARHVVLMTLSSLTLEETRDVDDRERLRDRLHSQLEKVIGTRSVRSVFFTDFVTQ